MSAYVQWDAGLATSSYRLADINRLMSDGNQPEERSTHAIRRLLRRRVRVDGQFSEAAACLGEFLRAKPLRTESFRAGNTFPRVVWNERLRRPRRFIENAWGLCSRHFVVRRESGDHKFRDEHYAELGDERRNKDCYYAWDVHIDIGRGVDER